MTLSDSKTEDDSFHGSFFPCVKNKIQCTIILLRPMRYFITRMKLVNGISKNVNRKRFRIQGGMCGETKNGKV